MKIKAEIDTNAIFLTLSENFACFFDKPSVTMQKKDRTAGNGKNAHRRKTEGRRSVRKLWLRSEEEL